MMVQLIQGRITEEVAKASQQNDHCSVHAIQGSNLSPKRCAAVVPLGCRHRHRCLQRYQTSTGGLWARIHFLKRYFIMTPKLLLSSTSARLPQAGMCVLICEIFVSSAAFLREANGLLLIPRSTRSFYTRTCWEDDGTPISTSLASGESLWT